MGPLSRNSIVLGWFVAFFVFAPVSLFWKGVLMTMVCTTIRLELAGDDLTSQHGFDLPTKASEVVLPEAAVPPRDAASHETSDDTHSRRSSVTAVSSIFSYDSPTASDADTEHDEISFPSDTEKEPCRDATETHAPCLEPKSPEVPPPGSDYLEWFYNRPVNHVKIKNPTREEAEAILDLYRPKKPTKEELDEWVRRTSRWY
ncbi:hypothetical protein QBC34DRAFT_113252 [Podospora aff. communis PSN243]|uniref:Uncharacterized protein n=1 Tax=Podospora aff. communis PSN243 TaxID=3040156 RepID=A0AAV9GKC0_9PEZI|nr:hypothetical protein QBC34DRAFT_113252 [Podospora aff. communis PSN243]